MARILAAALLCAIFAVTLALPAEARHRHKRHHYHRQVTADEAAFGFFEPHRSGRLDRGPAAAIGLGPRPRAWCGFFMRQYLGVTNPAGNLARWWVGYGRPSDGPAVGTLVVWRHHVGIITGRNGGGQWIVKSGNDGRAVRERPRSVAGAVAFRWPA
jgi:hypothetical protein